MSGSPPEMSTSLMPFFDLMYLRASSKRALDIGGCSSPTSLLRVQYLQYMAQVSVTMRSALSGYLCTSPGMGECLSSPHGSTISHEETPNSSSLGIACLRMGHLGSSLSMREKKYGVMAILRRPSALFMPACSRRLKLRSSESSSSEVILFLSCHLQSPQSSGRDLGSMMISVKRSLFFFAFRAPVTGSQLHG